MARPLRLTPPEGVHHVGHRAHGERTLFRDDGDRAELLRLFGVARRRFGIRVLTWCLMETHYHAVVEDPRGELSAALRFVHGEYASARNRAERDAGHSGARGAVFAGRFWSQLVQTDAYLLTAVRYIVRNPVAAGLCREPEDWPWSSHPGLVRGRPHPLLDADRLLRHFDADGPRTPREAYLAWIADAPSEASAPADVGLAGDHRFARAHLPAERPSPAIPARFLRPARRPLTEVVAGAPSARDAARAARREGYLLREIAEGLGRPLGTVGRWAAGE